LFRRVAIVSRASALRVTVLTLHLLAFSRQQVLERQVVDLVASVTQLQPMIARLIGADVIMKFDLATPPQWVLIDPSQFEQVVINLVVNARDAMPAGGRLRIALRRETVDRLHAAELEVKAGDYVVLSVADTGEGIDPEVQEYIFDPFFTTKPHGRGTGLGLSTVFGIVRQSGGMITVDSAVKRGTTFRVYFPLSPASAADVHTTPAVQRAASEACTILLAEDEQGVRTFLEMALRRAGHRVIAAGTGPDALIAGQNAAQPIDLLITDVVMPGLSGPDVADQLRRIHPGMRVLFLSGYSSHPALPERVTAEPASFLQKPFTVETLLARVHERLARPGTAAR
jgi:CheY-like chemotaxis protein